MSAIRHPYALTASRRLDVVDERAHIADLVRVTLLTNPGERLHHPELGAGLGASALFEGLDAARLGLISARVRGSLTEALGERIRIEQLDVRAGGESTIVVELRYRVRATGEQSGLRVRVGGDA